MAKNGAIRGDQLLDRSATDVWVEYTATVRKSDEAMKDVLKTALELKKAMAGFNEVKNQPDFAKQNDEYNRTVDRANIVLKEKERIDKRLIVLEERLKNIESEKNKNIIKTTGAINRANKELRDQDRIASSVNKTYQKLNAEYSRLNKLAQEAGAKFGYQSKQFKKASAAALRYRNNLDKIDGVLKNGQRNVGRYNTALSKSSRLFTGLVATLGVTAGIGAFVGIGRAIFNTVKELDGYNKALKKVSETEEKYIENKAYLADITERYGVSLNNTTKEYTKYLASLKGTNLEGKKGNIIFDKVIKTSAALGRTQDETNGILNAFTQIISKGTVQAEELRGQLGDRLPGAFNIMARSMNVSTIELNKLLQGGKVLADEVLPNFALELEKTFGLQSTQRVDTLQSATNRLSNTWVRFIDNMENGQGRVSKVLITLINLTSKAADAIGSLFLSEEQAMKKITDDTYSKTFKEEKARIEENVRLYHKGEIEKAEAGKERNELIKKLYKDEALIAAEAATKNLDLIQKEKDEKIKQLKILKESNLVMKNLYAIKGVTVHSIENEIKALSVQLARRKAILDVYKETLNVSKKINKPTNKPTDITTKKSTKEKDYNLYIQELRLKNQEESLKKELESEEKTALEKLDIAKELYSKREELAAVQLEKELAGVKKGTDQEEYIREKYFTKLLSIEEKFENDKVKIIDSNGKNIQKALKNALAKNEVTHNIEEEQLRRSLNKRHATEKEAQEALTQLKRKHARENAAIVIRELERVLNSSALSADARLAIEVQLSEAKKELAKSDGNFTIEQDKKIAEAIVRAANDLIGSLNDLGSTLYDRKIQRIDYEISKEEERYNRLIELASNDKRQQELLEKEREKNREKLEAKKRKEQERQAKFNKAAAIAQAIINTALAVASALTTVPTLLGLVLAPIVGAMGAIEIATIAATPIPKYRMGTKEPLKKNTWAVIGDGGVSEPVTKDGKLIGVSPDTPTLAYLPKGAEVHKDWDALFKKKETDRLILEATKASIMTGMLLDRSKLNKIDKSNVFDHNMKGMRDDIRREIRDGFRRMKINVNNNNSFDFEAFRYRMLND